MKRSRKIYLAIILLFFLFFCFRMFGYHEYDILLSKLDQSFFVNILQILAIFIGFIGTGLGILLQEKDNSNIKSISAAGLKNNLIGIYKLPLYLSFFGILFALFLILFGSGIDIPETNIGIMMSDFKSLFLMLFVAIILFYCRGISLLFQIIKNK